MTTTTRLNDVVKTPAFVKITVIALLSLSLFFLFNPFSSSYNPSLIFSSLPLLLSNTTPSSPPPLPTTLHETTTTTSSPPPPPPPPPSPSPPPPPPPKPPKMDMLIRMGIVDENGAMSTDFEVGEIDEGFDDEELEHEREKEREKEKEKERNGGKRVKVKKFKVCEDKSLSNYVPCLDNVEEIKRLNLSESVEKYERHCPPQPLDCVVPRPEGYQVRIPWPQSRNQVWLTNVPRTSLFEAKGSQKWISIKNNMYVFPGGGRAFNHLDRISKMIPDIGFGQKTRVALDIGSGVADFGALLMQHNVTTLSMAPKDEYANQIQFALERGVPAMVATFATRRLLYPSQAFDFIHCSECGVNWAQNDGIMLLEAKRMLRAGGYFIWAAEAVYKREENLREQWRGMENLATRICWELVKKEGYLAVWQKPLNNSCYLNRAGEVQPPLCDSDDDPDKVWYVNLRTCITRLPENGYGANVTTWPSRLHYPPDRLQSIEMDAYISRKEIFKAESKYWNEIITGYVGAFHWREFKLRNVLDMRAGYGGFAAALHDLEINCWVMNVVPVSGPNTLPVIYDRGLIGVRHDWCEPFDTYPRTYDLLHANGLFSVEKKRQRCDFSTIMLEMDRMLRPDGRVYIRDTISVIGEVNEIASALGWVPALRETGEGPHSSWRILICDKQERKKKNKKQRRKKHIN
nr:probable methyltransferase PMT10 isoform X1 [Quercus suber]